jgi:hypothetical protein
LKTLGLQLSEDTVAKVNGRIARSLDCAVRDLAYSILRLGKEFRGEPVEPEVHPVEDIMEEGHAQAAKLS